MLHPHVPDHERTIFREPEDTFSCAFATEKGAHARIVRMSIAIDMKTKAIRQTERLAEEHRPVTLAALSLGGNHFPDKDAAYGIVACPFPDKLVLMGGGIRTAQY